MDKDLGEQKKALPWTMKREKAMEAVDEEKLELIFSEDPPFMKQQLKLEVLLKTRMMDPLKRRQEEEEVLRLILNGPAPPNAPFIKRRILIRPHPAIWRLVHGMAVIYLIALTLLLFQLPCWIKMNGTHFLDWIYSSFEPLHRLLHCGTNSMEYFVSQVLPLGSSSKSKF